jgi:hypothetical protein
MKNALIIILLVFLSSCKKNPAPVITTIEGTVINIGSKQPIDSVKVTVVDGRSGSDSFFGSSKTSGTGKTVVKYTGTDGKFSISIEGSSPVLYLEKTGYEFVYFREGSSDSFKEYNPGKKYTNEILELWANAYFNPILKGINCQSNDTVLFDVMFYNSLERAGFEHQYLGNGPFKYMEWDANGYPGIGDKYLRYWFKYQIQGIWRAKIDSVFIKSFTTYTDTIYY